MAVENNGATSKAFTSIVMIAAIIGGVVAVVRPLQQRLDFTTAEIVRRMQRIEDRSGARIEAMDAKLQIEVDKVDQQGILRANRDEARLDKLEEWQRFIQRKHLMGMCAECGKRLEGK